MSNYVFSRDFVFSLKIHLNSAHFTYNTKSEEELSIRVNDIFHVTDTLYNGQIGSWVATKLNGSPSTGKITGAIPNKLR